MSLFDKILASRGIKAGEMEAFLHPDYDEYHDPFLLPDMKKAVDRIELALKNKDNITIYGDYDIDGLTATSVLLDALNSFGFKDVKAFIPNRFVEGYGLTVDAVEAIVKTGANLIITVDCGSLSHKEVERANELGVEVIVTDHHNISDVHPAAVAVVNPKRTDHKYPFIDLAGVGVAFKLVQALQTRLTGLDAGAEKWLLDLVALGTVCDVVSLVGENRTNVYWGLEVLKKTRRPGLRALMAVSRVDKENLNSRSLGFALGPRMNASGRLETAQYALDMLTTDDSEIALELAQKLDEMNQDRRAQQDVIFKEAVVQADKYQDEPVLVVSGVGWNHGIIGIVAAKLLETYQKPAFVLEEMGELAKGSARSYGDFSAVEAIRSADDIIIKGGGHKLAAGINLRTESIDKFRVRLNEFYKSKKLTNQAELLLPREDAVAELGEVNIDLIDKLSALEPFGSGNPEPILRTNNLSVLARRTMGADGQHVKYTLKNNEGASIDLIAFSSADRFILTVGERVDAWYQPTVNEWRGVQKIEGYLKNLEARLN